MSVVLAAALAAAVPAVTPPVPSASTLQQVEVTAARAPVLGDTQRGVLDFKPEFFTPARPATAMDMIKWLPGFTFEDTRDLRGLGGALGNVLIDGQPPTAKTDTLLTVLSRIPSSQVERVDLIIGGAPGIDMRGRPIIANVILKKSTAPRIVAQLQGFIDQDQKFGPDFLLTSSLNRSGKLTEWSVDVGRGLAAGPGIGHGPWVRTDGLGHVLFAAEVKAFGRFPFAVLTGAQERPAFGGKLKLNGSVRYQQYQLDETDRLATGAESFGQINREDYFQGELGLRYERSLSPRTTLEAQLLERRSRARPHIFLNKPPVPSVTNASTGLQEGVGRATVRFKRDETLTVESAAEIAANGLDTRSGLSLNGVPTRILGSNVEVREKRGEAGVTVTWKPSPRYSLIGAAKGEYSHLITSGDVSLSRDLSYVKPRAVFTYAPDKETQVRLRVEREVQQINFYNFAAVTELNTNSVRLGNSNLKPQSAWVAEAVLEKRFWNGASVTLTARQSKVNDVLDEIPLSSGTTVVGQVANIGDGDQTDLIWAVTLPLKRFGLNGAMVKGGMTWTHSSVVDPTTGEHRRFNFQPPVQIDGHFTYDLPRWKLTWGVDGTYFGHAVLFRPTSYEDRGYNGRINLFVEHRTTPSLTLRAEFDNITNFAWPQAIRVYSGARGLSPLLYRDDKAVSLHRFFYVRIRKTLG